MTIAENKVVTLHYTLTDDKGTIIDKSDDGSFLYLHGASNIIPGLENALTGKKPGEELKVTVKPEDGYGERDDNRLESVPREMFPDDTEIEAGMQRESLVLRRHHRQGGLGGYPLQRHPAKALGLAFIDGPGQDHRGAGRRHPAQHQYRQQTEK